MIELEKEFHLDNAHIGGRSPATCHWKCGDACAQPILNQLYLHTQMQVTFGINLVAIVGNRPELLSLKDLLRHFLEHRKEVIIRRTRFELKQAEARAHILGLEVDPKL